MNRFHRGTIWGIALSVLFCFVATTVGADEGKNRQRKRERGHNEENHSGNGSLKPVGNSTYADKCAACHFAYQPELLPAGSWRKILESTDNHFGQTLDLDQPAILEITGYLTSNAADTSSARLARKIVSCLDGGTPLRITEIPCFRKKHHDISPQVAKRPSVGSLSNCIACHRTAGNGVYDDDRVSIPE